MNLTNSAAVNAATSATQSSSAGAVPLLVLRKALDSQASSAASLLDSIPEPPTLANEGSVGRLLNTFA